jgi:uncharacterized FlaG/YvyC family protein
MRRRYRRLLIYPTVAHMRIEAEQNNWQASAQETKANTRVGQAEPAPRAKQSAATEESAGAQLQNAKTRPTAKAEITPVPQFPQDEVKVQRDKQFDDGVMVYQLLDKQSGTLVLQVPSRQVLSVAHAISESLQADTAKQEAASAANDENGKR